MSTNELTTTARTYREIMADIKVLEEQADALKAVMIAEMDVRQAEEMAAGEYKIRYTVYESNRLDTAKLKAERPEVYAGYIKNMTATRFQVA